MQRLLTEHNNLVFVVLILRHYLLTFFCLCYLFFFKINTASANKCMCIVCKLVIVQMERNIKNEKLSDTCTKAISQTLHEMRGAIS